MNSSGTNVATIRLKPWMEGDRIPPELRAELQRIFEVVFENREDSDIVSTLAAPSDLTKIWWPINATTGTREGNPKIWDETKSLWVDFGTAGIPKFVYRKRRNGIQQVASGKGAQIIEFADMGTLDYQVHLTPVLFADGSFIAAPANLDTFTWAIGAKGQSQFTLNWWGAPTGGISFDWQVTENAGTEDILGQEA